MQPSSLLLVAFSLFVATSAYQLVQVTATPPSWDRGTGASIGNLATGGYYTSTAEYARLGSTNNNAFTAFGDSTLKFWVVTIDGDVAVLPKAGNSANVNEDTFSANCRRAKTTPFSPHFYPLFMDVERGSCTASTTCGIWYSLATATFTPTSYGGSACSVIEWDSFPLPSGTGVGPHFQMFFCGARTFVKILSYGTAKPSVTMPASPAYATQGMWHMGTQWQWGFSDFYCTETETSSVGTRQALPDAPVTFEYVWTTGNSATCGDNELTLTTTNNVPIPAPEQCECMGDCTYYNCNPVTCTCITGSFPDHANTQALYPCTLCSEANGSPTDCAAFIATAHTYTGSDVCAWCIGDQTCKSIANTADVCKNCGDITVDTACPLVNSDDSLNKCFWCPGSGDCKTYNAPCDNCAAKTTEGTCTGWSDSKGACHWCYGDSTCQDSETTCPTCADKKSAGKTLCNAWSDSTGSCHWCDGDGDCYVHDTPCASCADKKSAGQADCDAWADDTGACHWCAGDSDCYVHDTPCASCSDKTTDGETACNAWSDDTGACHWCAGDSTCYVHDTPCASCSSKTTDGKTVCNNWVADDGACHWCDGDDTCYASGTPCATCADKKLDGKVACNDWADATGDCHWCDGDNDCYVFGTPCDGCSDKTDDGEAICNGWSDDTGACHWCAGDSTCYVHDTPCASCSSKTTDGKTVCNNWIADDGACHWCDGDDTCYASGTPCATCADKKLDGKVACNDWADATGDCHWCDGDNDCYVFGTPCDGCSDKTDDGEAICNGWSDDTGSCHWCTGDSTCYVHDTPCDACSDKTDDGETICNGWSVAAGACHWCAGDSTCYAPAALCPTCASKKSAGKAACNAWSDDTGACHWCDGDSDCYVHDTPCDSCSDKTTDGETACNDWADDTGSCHWCTGDSTCYVHNTPCDACSDKTDDGETTCNGWSTTAGACHWCPPLSECEEAGTQCHYCGDGDIDVPAPYNENCDTGSTTDPLCVGCVCQWPSEPDPSGTGCKCHDDPLDGHTFWGEPKMQVNWVDGASNKAKLHFAMQLPNTAGNHRSSVSASFDQLDSGKTVTLTWPTWTDDYDHCLFTIESSFEVGDMAAYASPSVFDADADDEYWVDWRILVKWQEVVTVYKRAVPTTITRNNENSFNFRLIVEKRQTVSSTVSILSPELVWAITQRSKVLTGYTTTMEIQFYTYILDSSLYIDSATTGMAVTIIDQPNSQIADVSFPTLVHPATEGQSREQTWSVNITFVPGTCQLKATDGFKLKVGLLSSDSANPVHIYPVELTFMTNPSEMWCVVQGLELLGQQTSYLGADFAQTTTKYWLDDTVFVRTQWHTNTSMVVDSVFVEKVVVTGAALSGASVTVLDTFVAAPTQLNYQDLTGAAGVAVCTGDSGCYSFYTDPALFQYGADGAPLSFTITTTARVTYYNAHAKRFEVETKSISSMITRNTVSIMPPSYGTTKTTTGQTVVQYKTSPALVATLVSLAVVAVISVALAAFIFFRNSNKK